MVVELQQLEEVMNKLDKHTEDPFKLPEASEQVGDDDNIIVVEHVVELAALRWCRM